jgi:hypothetical protein
MPALLARRRAGIFTVRVQSNRRPVRECSMTIDISPVPLDEDLPLRELYRREMNCQIVHDSLPRRGFGDLFLIRADGRVAGYGFVMGYRGEPREMIREFFILPAYRSAALPIFRQLIEISRATRVMAQTNDILLTLKTGLVPAARCNVTNAASRATLQKAGLLPCARLLSSVLVPAINEQRSQ